MDLNLDLEKLKEKRIATFLSKDDIKAIVDCLKATTKELRTEFREKYSQEYTTELGERLSGKFKECVGKTLVIIDGVISAGTVSFLLLPYLPEDEVERAFTYKQDDLKEASKQLLEFFEKLL